MKPNALVVTRNLPPLVGGMERLIWHLIDELRTDYQVHVVGPYGCEKQLPFDVHSVGIPLKPMAFFLLRAKLTALKLALSSRPNLIFAGSGLTAPFVWLAARVTGARCVVYLHGLDIIINHPLYRLFWLPFFCRFDCVLVNSYFTRQLAVEMKISKKRITILHPGVKLPDMVDFKKRNISFRSRYNLNNVPFMLYVGRITPRKGLLCFVREIMPYVLLKVPEAVLVVVGDAPTDALHSVKDERGRVESVLEENGFQLKVFFLGRCSEKDLDDAYFAADVLIFPLQQQKDDIEGFGMVAIEAAAHGLPTVAFSVGGVADAVADGCSGRLIPGEDNIAFGQAVIKLLTDRKLSEQVNDCRKFAEKFEWDAFGTRLRNICHTIETGA